MVILSHADSDHYNGLPDLLDRFSVGEVRVPPGFAGPANPGAVELLQEVRARGVPIRPIAAGDHWQTTAARFSVWHPPRAGALSPSLTSDNARSVVLDLEADGHHVLLTGDLENEGLDALEPVPDSARWMCCSRPTMGAGRPTRRGSTTGPSPASSSSASVNPRRGRTTRSPRSMQNTSCCGPGSVGRSGCAGRGTAWLRSGFRDNQAAWNE